GGVAATRGSSGWSGAGAAAAGCSSGWSGAGVVAAGCSGFAFGSPISTLASRPSGGFASSGFGRGGSGGGGGGSSRTTSFAGIGADHDIVRLGRDRARDIGAERFGPRLGFRPRHRQQTAGEDERLTSKRRGGAAGRRLVVEHLNFARQIVEDLAIMRLGEKA